MGIEQVPSTYAFICDVCGKRVIEDFKRWTEPEYTDAPEGWCYVELNMHGVDKAGDGYKSAGREEILCCPDHAPGMVNAIHKEWKQNEN